MAFDRTAEERKGLHLIILSTPDLLLHLHLLVLLSIARRIRSLDWSI